MTNITTGRGRGLYGNFATENHFSELGTPILGGANGTGVISAAARRQLALENLLGNTDVTIADLIKAASVSSAAGTLPAVTGLSVAEYGDAVDHTTIFTFADVAFGATDDSTALASGLLIYTFPAGIIEVLGTMMSLGLTTEGGATPTTDTPDLGVGTTIASGANAVLSSVAGSENIMTGQTVNNLAGTVEFNTVTTNLGIAAAGDHTVYLNVADTWADFTPNDPGLVVNGTLAIRWSKLT